MPHDRGGGRPVVYILNASSRTDTGITEDLALSAAWLNASGACRVEAVTLTDGPNGIVGAVDSARAAPAVLGFIAREAEKAETGGFVVACFTDPGVYPARELTGKPVVGVGEAGFYAALSMGDRIGTIGVSAGHGPHRMARHLGVQDRIAGHRGLGLDYSDLRRPDVVTARMIEAGTALRDEAGAEALLFAGAGLARYVAPLQDATGLPVVDPTQAALGIVAAQIMQAAYATAVS
ncbi:aspartate/glutamate racemase family protein [Acuticoccus sediminis]|uniref:aspartate/glutamate racemase family protein n=1 Tax=Acuticoccus sediminis TaxID=2184697 RepID=UPI001CFE0E95|nr:aspartate/glutamate racemase family protein [Acuticoccus sediminis]